MTIERENEIIKLIREDWEYFGTLSGEEQTNTITNFALLLYPWTFKLIKSKKMKTYDRCMRAVVYDGSLLYCVPKKIQDNSLVSMAVYKYAPAYNFIKNDALKTFELSLSAVKRWGLIINIVPKSLKKRVIDTIIAQKEKRLGRKLNEKELKGIIEGYDVKT